MKFRKTYWMLLFPLFADCVDPIAFDVESTKSQLVIDGSITSGPGPYVVTLTRTRELRSDIDHRARVSGATVTIFSDAGEEETLNEKSPGTYTTSTIQGTVGRSYYIRIITVEGATYESIPEPIKPAGEIESVWYEYEKLRKKDGAIEVNDDRLNVYLNASTPVGEENYIRWRVIGTLEVLTHPKLRVNVNYDFNPPLITPEPIPCSGWVFRNNLLTEVDTCSCCTCWITNYEPVPQVSDEQFIEGNQFRNRKVGLVPIKAELLIMRFHASVSQMSISRTAYNYFRLIKAQKEGAASLFQPVAGKLRGNIIRINGSEEAQGLFWAAGVTDAAVFVDRDNLPEHLKAPEPRIIDCRTLQGATATKPSFWK
jgi:hypothetical protein